MSSHRSRGRIALRTSHFCLYVLANVLVPTKINRLCCILSWNALAARQIVLYSISQRNTEYSTSRHGYLRLPRNCLAFQPNVGTCTVANKQSTWIFFVGETLQEVSHSHGIYLRVPIVKFSKINTFEPPWASFDTDGLWCFWIAEHNKTGARAATLDRNVWLCGCQKIYFSEIRYK